MAKEVLRIVVFTSHNGRFEQLIARTPRGKPPKSRNVSAHLADSYAYSTASGRERPQEPEGVEIEALRAATSDSLVHYLPAEAHRGRALPAAGAAHVPRGALLGDLQRGLAGGQPLGLNLGAGDLG